MGWLIKLLPALIVLATALALILVASTPPLYS